MKVHLDFQDRQQSTQHIPVPLRAVNITKSVIVVVGKNTCAIHMVPHESWSTCSHVTNITNIYRAVRKEINNFLYIWNI